MADPYDAVRYIAYRSLRERPGFADLDYDYMGPPEERLAAARQAAGIWRGQRRAAGELTDLTFLMGDATGSLADRLFEHLASQRNDRRVSLAE